MAAFVAKQMVGNKLNAVKGRPWPSLNDFILNNDDFISVFGINSLSAG
jgi:hypothetical protein